MPQDVDTACAKMRNALPDGVIKPTCEASSTYARTKDTPGMYELSKGVSPSDGPYEIGDNCELL